MGTVSFTVPTGEITAVRIEREYLGPEGEILVERPRKGTALERLMRTAIRVSPPTALAYDQRLSSTSIKAAKLIPVPEIPNWGRYIANRVLPIQGLFSYDRDIMVVEAHSNSVK